MKRFPVISSTLGTKDKIPSTKELVVFQNLVKKYGVEKIVVKAKETETQKTRKLFKKHMKIFMKDNSSGY